MERFILANTLASFDFDLLTSDKVRNYRGYWGETLEVKFRDGVIFVYVDENCDGFIKMYNTQNFQRMEQVFITKDNFFEEIKRVINKAKECEKN